MRVLAGLPALDMLVLAGLLEVPLDGVPAAEVPAVVSDVEEEPLPVSAELELAGAVVEDSVVELGPDDVVVVVVVVCVLTAPELEGVVVVACGEVVVPVVPPVVEVEGAVSLVRVAVANVCRL